jgi:hypothetical protein
LVAVNSLWPLTLEPYLVHKESIRVIHYWMEAPHQQPTQCFFFFPLKILISNNKME